MTTYFASQEIYEGEPDGRLAEVAYECLDHLASKGCDLKTVRYKAEPIKPDPWWSAGVRHSWFADTR